MPKKYESMEERLIANSVLSETCAHKGSRCWEWIGRVKANRSGTLYGVVTLRWKAGPRKGKVRSVYAHRLAIVIFKGRVMTRRMTGRHLCNNTICINPAHLVGGSQRANVRQCVREGRHRNGHK